MLELKNVSKNYGEVRAVSDVSLEIKDGEFFSLLGPSGCGKTSLLRILAGFEALSAGEIHHDGVRIDTLQPHLRQFNLVFQKYALFPHLSVRENIAFGLRMKKIGEPELSNRVRDALSLVQLGQLAEREIATLSGGQQQRVALARAFVNRPKVLLLDEPLSALDLKLRQQMQVELVRLQRQLKHTFVFVTHDQEEALTLSDRIAVMNQGRVEQIGTPEEIYEAPKTLFVARFIGSINSIPVKVDGGANGSISVRTKKGVSLSVRPRRGELQSNQSIPKGSEATLMIRPEKVRFSTGSAEQNTFTGVIREVIFRGPHTQYSVDADGMEVTLTQSNSNADAKLLRKTGEKVGFNWSPEDCFLISAGAHDA